MGIKDRIQSAFWQMGYLIDEASPGDDVLQLIRKLKPKSVGRELIRIGEGNDGGYLVPDDLDGIKACFSPGVAGTSSFELALAERYKIKSFLADFSVDGPAVRNEMFDFEKKYLGHSNDDVYMRLEDWFNAKTSGDQSEDYLLQMDIEGAEFGVLIDTPANILRRFRIMIIEVHNTQMFFDAHYLKVVDSIFSKVLRDFSVAHIHPNNWAPCYAQDGVEVPFAFEMTFYRNDRVVEDGTKLTFPHPLDARNVPHREDVVLPKVWWQ